jgi:imidazolonepropionase-like amidohydrolase
MMGRHASFMVSLLFALAAMTMPAAAKPSLPPDPFPSTYKPLPRQDTLIVNATILDGEGKRIDNGALFLKDGKVAAIGASLAAPDNATVIDAGGRWVTPGIVDMHSHMGQASLPLTPNEVKIWDVNENATPNAAHVWAEHAIKVQDPVFQLALAGGVTTVQVLPGSHNLFGGRGVILKNIPGVTVQDMKFPDAPVNLKMACGENPKYHHGSKGQEPGSRMGIIAGYRAAFEAAREYERKGKSAPRDFKLELLAGVLRGEVRVHVHCYRADDMANVLAVAREYGFEIAALHHAPEAYKIAGLLAERNVCAAVWSDWWGFKMEAYDGIRENAAFVEAAGGCTIIHSDMPELDQRLNIDAAKAMAAGRRAGVTIPPEQAIRWITSNAARSIGLDDRIGALTPGKNADVVVWSGDPFSVYTKADMVFIDGAVVYDRHDPARQPVSDFMLGQPSAGDAP